jgi:hypothetical protein
MLVIPVPTQEHRRRPHAGLVAIVAAALCLHGCYHARVSFPDTAPQGMEPRSETLWSLAWGLSQQNLEPRDCPSASLSEVTTSTNIGFVLLTVVSLGFVSAVKVEFRCAKLPGGEIR